MDAAEMKWKMAQHAHKDNQPHMPLLAVLVAVAAATDNNATVIGMMDQHRPNQMRLTADEDTHVQSDDTAYNVAVAADGDTAAVAAVVVDAPLSHTLAMY